LCTGEPCRLTATSDPLIACLPNPVVSPPARLPVLYRETGVSEIFDVTKYLDDHPGGGEILVDASGKDATNMFVSIGHSESAYETMEGLKIGVLKMSAEEKKAKEDARIAAAERASAGGLGFIHVLALLIVILVGIVMSNDEYKAQVMGLMGKN